MKDLEQLKQKYPKFFSHPHYWIDAIEVECLLPESAGEVMKWDANLYNSSYYRPKDFKPLFKPQEGEQFIKDLEVAVLSSLKAISSEISEFQYKPYRKDEVFHEFIFKYLGDSYSYQVAANNISCAMCIEDSHVPMVLLVDSAAYTDKLRELGYYV